jgi:hypothetical protein
MSTKRPRRPQARRDSTLSPELRTYLERGEYGSDLDVFRLAGEVLHRNYRRLRALWNEHGDEILANWDDDEPPFAQQVLDVIAADPDDWRAVLAILRECRARADEADA